MSEYILAKDGVYKKFGTDLFRGSIKVGFPIPFQEELDTIHVQGGDIREKIEIVFKRMPIALFQQALAFMEFCYEDKKAEGMVCFRYRAGEWSIVIPEQWNSGTSVCYHLKPEESSFIMGDVHSHPKFASSAHSTTDNLDERKLSDGIFMVVKDFDIWNCEPSIVGVVDGVSFPIKPQYMFDLRTAHEKSKPDVPDEWKAKVHGLPCDGCRREREGAQAAVQKTEAERKAEEEKEARLVPSDLVEVYRKSIAQGKSRGKAFYELIQEWQAKSKYNGKVFRCGNHGCKKFLRTLECPDCKKSVTSYEVMEMLSLAIDELDALEEVKGDLKVLVELNAPQSEAAKTDPASQDTDIILVGEGPECTDACHHKKNGTPHTHFDPAKFKAEDCKNTACADVGHMLLTCPDRIKRLAKVPAKDGTPASTVSTPAEHQGLEAPWEGI